MLSVEFAPMAFSADPQRPLAVEAELYADGIEGPVAARNTLMPWPRPRGQSSMVGYWQHDRLGVVH
jgi:hypothetical protein